MLCGTKSVRAGAFIRLTRLQVRFISSDTNGETKSKEELLAQCFDSIDSNASLKGIKGLKPTDSVNEVFPGLDPNYYKPKEHQTNKEKRKARLRRNEQKNPKPVIVHSTKKVIRAQKGSLPKHITEKLAKQTKKQTKSFLNFDPELVKLKSRPRKSFDSEDYYKGFQIPEDYVKLIDEVKSPIISQTFDGTSIYQPLDVQQETQVPNLKHSLSRVLFSPGVHYLQDPRSKVFNFDPYLQNILPVNEFNFDHVTQYVTSHKDKAMMTISEKLGTKYYSSTSSMTGILSHLHFFLSNFKPVYCQDFSFHMKTMARFTRGAQLPGIVIVRKMPGGKFAIDSDKSSDKEIVLSLLGHSLERLLVSEPELFEKYKKSNTDESALKEIQEIEKTGNTYHYAKMGDFVMRSQLDCQDSRLPGTGTFDLKTRAVCAVRHDMTQNEKEVTGYEIVKTVGEYESFEKELFELAKSTMLKYSLQARIGNMDGIFILFHNIAKTFGFQYLPLTEIDKIIHSVGMKAKEVSEFENDLTALDSAENFNKLASKVANDEFNISMKIWNQILDLISTDYLPNTSFRLIFKAVLAGPYETVLHVVAHPLTEFEVEKIQSFGMKSSEAVMSDDDAFITEHVSKLRELNKEVGKDIIGFNVMVKHKFNGVETSLKFPKPSSLDDQWEADIKIEQSTLNAATRHYEQYVDEKVRMLEYHGSVKTDDEVDSYVKLLRAFGNKGKKRAASQGEGNIVWNKD